MGHVNLPRLCTKNFNPPTKPALAHTPTQENLRQPNLHVSIVSNSHLLREALLLLLQSRWSVDLVNSYTGDADIAATVTNPSKHLVLLDSGIGQDALTARIQEWRTLQPTPYLVVLELKNDTDLILDCIEAGAHGYALQGASSAEVIQVIGQVHQGVAQCSPEITAKLFDRLMRSRAVQQPREKPPLTCRELEVLCYVAQDYSDRDIAAALFIEVRTVKHHIHNILRKLNVKYRRDAAQLALDQHWLESVLKPSNSG